MIATSVTELAPVVGTSAACTALAVSRATHSRRTAGRRLGPPTPRPRPARALDRDRADDHPRPPRADVLAGACATHPERFVNGPPRPRPVPGEVRINRPPKEVQA